MPHHEEETIIGQNSLIEINPSSPSEIAEQISGEQSREVIREEDVDPVEDTTSRKEYRRRIREDLKKVRELMNKHHREVKAWLTLSGTEVGNKTILLVNPLMLRSAELMESAIIDMKKGNLLSALSAVRTHYEVVGTLAMVLKKLRGYTPTETNQQNLLEHLRRLTLGVGRELREEYPDIDVASIHALDRIRCVDELLPYDPDPEFKPCFTAYSDLCEFVHLNFSASHMTITYYPNHQTVDLLDPDKILNLKARIMNWLAISSGRSWLIYKELMHYLEQAERLPKGGRRITHKIQRLIAEAYLKVRIPLHRSGIWKIKKTQ